MTRVGDRVRVRFNLLDGDCCFSGLTGEVRGFLMGLVLVALDDDPDQICQVKDEDGRPLAYITRGSLLPK